MQFWIADQSDGSTNFEILIDFDALREAGS